MSGPLILSRDTDVSTLAQALRARVLVHLQHGPSAAAVVAPDGLDDPVLADLLPHATAASWLDGIGALRLAAVDRPEPSAAHLARLLDDLPRRVAFEWLAQVRGQPALEQDAVAAVGRMLGPPADWAPALKRALSSDAAHLVLVLTWQCEIRCSYCAIPKQAGREMTRETVDQAVSLLLSSDAERLELRFFGGEPMMAWPLIQHAIETATAGAAGRELSFLITSNGWALSEQRLRWLVGRPVRLQVALEGDRAAQNRFRVPLDPALDSYDRSVAPFAPLLRELGLDHDLIWVVNPASVDQMLSNFTHLAELGFPRIQLNWAHGQLWSPARRARFAEGLHQVAAVLRERWARGQGPWLVNLEETLARVRTFREPTVDWDGTVLANNAFLYRPQERDALRLGHVDALEGLDRYRFDGLDDGVLLGLSFPAAVSENNAHVGAVLNSFVRWMHGQGLPDPATLGAG